MSYFTNVIDKYLANWILPDTCLTPEDIEDRFYLFVMSINRYSRLLRDRTRSPYDDDIVDLPPRHQQWILNRRCIRNPRTYDKSGFIEKVSLAIKRNHPVWSEEYITDEVQNLAEKAMLILDALWYARHFPDNSINRSLPPLK